jgi:NADPH-dependent curcumin reductase CurA
MLNTLWIIAGTIMGWIMFDMLSAALFASLKKVVSTPVWYRLGAAFVGGLTAYTILTHYA